MVKTPKWRPRSRTINPFRRRRDHRTDKDAFWEKCFAAAQRDRTHLAINTRNGVFPGYLYGDEEATPMITVHTNNVALSNQWDDVALRLQHAGMRVFCPNFFSPDGSLPHSHDDTVEYIRDMCDELGFEKVILAGHQWGGAVAAKFATKYPESVSHLVLASPALSDENVVAAIECPILLLWPMNDVEVPYYLSWMYQKHHADRLKLDPMPGNEGTSVLYYATNIHQFINPYSTKTEFHLQDHYQWTLPDVEKYGPQGHRLHKTQHPFNNTLFESEGWVLQKKPGSYQTQNMANW